MYALHTKKEAAHNDSIWCCDWRQIKHVKEAAGEGEGEMESQVTEVEDIVVTGGVDDVVKIWNYREGELEYRHQLTDHSLGVVSVAISGDGRRVASSSLDSVIIVWDTLTGAKVATMETGPVDAWSVIFTHDDKYIVSGSHTGNVNMFSVDTGKLEHSLDSKSKFTLSLAASSDGKHLATGAIDGIINVFDLGTKKLVHTLEGHAMPIRSLCFSPDSTKLLTGSDDGHLKLYDISHATLLGTMSGEHFQSCPRQKSTFKLSVQVTRRGLFQFTFVQIMNILSLAAVTAQSR